MGDYNGRIPVQYSTLDPNTTADEKAFDKAWDQIIKNDAAHQVECATTAVGSVLPGSSLKTVTKPNGAKIFGAASPNGDIVAVSQPGSGVTVMTNILAQDSAGTANYLVTNISGKKPEVESRGVASSSGADNLAHNAANAYASCIAKFKPGM